MCSRIPEQHVALTHAPLRLSRMGVKVGDATTGPVNELTLAELSIGENLRGAIAIARCPRSELPPKEDLVAKAERYLWRGVGLKRVTDRAMEHRTAAS